MDKDLLQRFLCVIRIMERVLIILIVGGLMAGIVIYTYRVDKPPQTEFFGHPDPGPSAPPTYTGNLMLKLVRDIADEQQVPLALVLAMIEIESRWDPDAVNRHNNDGSYDYGLTQLNSQVYSKYTERELKRPELNLRLGFSHLRELYDQYGTWEYAIYRYNGHGTPAFRHMVKVLSREREIILQSQNKR